MKRFPNGQDHLKNKVVKQSCIESAGLLFTLLALRCELTKSNLNRFIQIADKLLIVRITLLPALVAVPRTWLDAAQMRLGR